MFEEDYRELAEKVLADVKDATENDANKLADKLQETCEEFVTSLRAVDEEGADEPAPEDAEGEAEEGEKPPREPEEVG